MPPPSPTQVAVRYYLRRPGGAATGPYEAPAIAAMLAEGRLNGSEEISPDRKAWKPVGALAKEIPSAPAATTPRAGPLELENPEDPDGISLAPLEIGFDEPNAVAGPREPRAPAAAGAGGGAAGPSTESDRLGAGAADLDLGISLELELEERKPVPRPRLAPLASRGEPGGGAGPSGTGRSPGKTAGSPGELDRAAAPPVPERSGGGADPAQIGRPAGIPDPIGTDASAFVAAFLEGETEPGVEATLPVRLDEILPAPEARARPRTMTAARPGRAGPTPGIAWRPSRRQILIIGAVLLVGIAGAGAVLFEVPDRLRGEPSTAKVLGPVASAIAEDRFGAFLDGAGRLEESVSGRRRAPVTRATAAELLAASVVLHGAERGRIPRAEALLDEDIAPPARAAAVRARAAAWVALAKGRWKDAERIAAKGALPAADRAVILGWAALGREDATRAAGQFQQAIAGEPTPVPSRVAARYALARARESELSPAAEAAYRAVLAEAPAHVGAALGLARLSKLSPAVRIKLIEAVIAKQARDASRGELAEAHALLAQTKREVGDSAGAEAALKRAREVDPASVAAAVAAGDALLADGRTDEAIRRYKSALAAPVSATRTSALRLARTAALLDAGRAAEAQTALGDLDRRLPGDARIAFWRGWAAERARPPDTVAADRAYREALARDPKFLPASLQLARLLLDQRRGADAVAVLRRAETEGAAAVTLRIALGQSLLGSGNAAEAARMFRQALGTDPNNPRAHLGLAGALEVQGDLEGARVELASLAARGEVPRLGSRVAAILVKLGRRDEALAAYQTEISSGGATAGTKVAAARLAIDLGRKDAARTLAEAAISDDPRTPGALLMLAEVWRLEGDHARALAELRRAMAVDGSPEVQLEFGRALAALGRDEEALGALSRARDIPEAGVERGRILLRRGDAEGAVKELTAAIASLPSQADAHLLLGQAEDRLGHVARAEIAWKAAARLAPTVAESRYRLGRLEMDRGHAAIALPHLRAAAERLPPGGNAEPPWRADLYFQLGFAETRGGSRDRGQTAFRRYLEVAPADAAARVEVKRQLGGSAP